MFNKTTMDQNRISAKQALDIQKLYMDKSCGVITNSLEVLMGYSRQQAFLIELYPQIVKYFGEYENKGPKDKVTKKQECSQPSKELMIMFHEKVSSLGFPDEFAEVELLEKLINGSLDIQPQLDIDEQDQSEKASNDNKDDEQEHDEDKKAKSGIESDEEEEEWIANSDDGSEDGAKRAKKTKQIRNREDEAVKASKKSIKSNLSRMSRSEDEPVKTSEDLVGLNTSKKVTKMASKTCKNSKEKKSKSSDSVEKSIQKGKELMDIESTRDSKTKLVSKLKYVEVNCLKDITNIEKHKRAEVADEKKSMDLEEEAEIVIEEEEEEDGNTDEEKIDKKMTEENAGRVKKDGLNNKKESAKGKVNKRGRPAKAEKIAIEIEKDYKSEIKDLKGKLSIEDAQKALGNSKIDGNQEDSETIQQQIKKTLDWKKKYKDCIENNRGNMEELVEELQELELEVPEMKSAIQKKKCWRLWQNKAKGLMRRLKKKNENLFESNEDMVTIEEIEEIIKEADDIESGNSQDKTLQEFKTKLKNVQKIQEKFQSSGHMSVLSFQKDAEKKLKTQNIKIPEFKILKQRVKKFFDYNLNHF